MGDKKGKPKFPFLLSRYLLLLLLCVYYYFELLLLCLFLLLGIIFAFT